ncbi:unnamed protein product [Mytilus edulis]|uniref:TRPM SLOG domain-containing protein n=1 Tax=Mytilus edulis TaxID=6550 RepID=A0A8S3PUY3_MYTED|nr:unnamed protein product [Mytilus edulis]
MIEELNFDSLRLMHKKHYVCVPWDATPYELTYFMERFWNMRSPKIVLSIMSGVRNEKIWKNPRLRDQFKKGLIKAANSTEMWIVTNGVDNGIASIVGEAVNEEKFIRTNSRVDLSQLRPDAVKKFHRLTVIGVIQKQKVIYNDQLDGSEGLTLTNEGCKPNKDIHELNPDHTHFILVESETEDHYIDFRSNFEKQLECQLGRPRRYRRLLSYNSDENEAEVVEPPPQTIPVVGLLIQGRPQKIDLVLFYLRHKMPVVVVKGTGGCANLLAYAIEETQDRSVAEVGHLSPELLKLIIHNFPDDFNKNDFARNAFRDKIIECVTLSKEDDRTFMTVITTQGADGNLADLDKYILKALLKSEIKKSSRWRERAYKDLTLLLDWNRADLAQTEIFSSENVSKIKVDKTLFEKSLIRKDREEFVSLFLEQGYQIHKYLNHKNLKYLFERAEDSEFFSTVCLEGILGKHYMIPDQSLPNDFLINDLNKLVAKLSGIKDFIQPYELSMNSAELYVLDPAVAERKAVNCLIVWAVLLSRPKLAKVLWYRCDEPIPVALICSNIYRELSKCPMERSQRNDMEERAKSQNNTTYKRMIWDYRNADFDKCNELIATFDWESIINAENSMDQNCKNFTNKFLEYINDCIPQKEVTIRPNDKIWFNSDLRREIRKRDRLHKQARRSNSIPDLNKYKKQRNNVNNLKRYTKDQFYLNANSLLDEFASGNSKSYWSLMKKLAKTSGNSTHITQLKNENDELVTENYDKACLLNKYFCSISTINENNDRSPEFLTRSNSKIDIFLYKLKQVRL